MLDPAVATQAEAEEYAELLSLFLVDSFLPWFVVLMLFMMELTFGSKTLDKVQI